MISRPPLGLSGLEVARGRRPNLWGLDVDLPDLDGWEACVRRHVDPVRRNTPVTVAAAHGEQACALAVGTVVLFAKARQPAGGRACGHMAPMVKRQDGLLRPVGDLNGPSPERQPLAFVTTDIDRFKRQDSDCGHSAVANALRPAAGALRAGMLRPMNLPTRHGGEGFVGLLPDTHRDGAERLSAGVAVPPCVNASACRGVS